jgi:TldD protein
MRLIQSLTFIVLACALQSWSGNTKDSCWKQSFHQALLEAHREIATQDETPYFASIRWHENQDYSLEYVQGFRTSTRKSQQVVADLSLRIGSHLLDHTMPDPDGEISLHVGVQEIQIPETCEPKLIRTQVRRAYESAYRQAMDKWVEVKANQEQIFETDTVPIFESLSPEQIGVITNQERHQKIIQSDSLPFDSLAMSLDSSLKMMRIDTALIFHKLIWQSQLQRRHYLDLDGLYTQEVSQKHWSHRSLWGRSQDGIEQESSELEVFSGMDIPWASQQLPKSLENEKQLFDSLLKAKNAEPYAGPVLLEGPAAAVWVHEVIGHRLEADRLRSISDGQTFLSKINQRILPKTWDLWDKPNLTHYGDNPLLGHYHFDDQGMVSQDVPLIVDGILKNFLLSRTPIAPGGKIQYSNGHGRGELGLRAEARMGNLILSPKKGLSQSELHQKLLALAQAKKLPYALRVAKLGGGFTQTERGNAQSFKLNPFGVYKVFVDGRPDELVRGLDVSGTPLATLTQLVAGGDQLFVFNGFCGSSSGWVPVSAQAPALLLDNLELERSLGSPQKPPLTPMPSLQKPEESR